MEKRQVICGFLFPATQQTRRTVELAMRALNDPATRSMSRDLSYLGLFLASTADVVEIDTYSNQQTQQRIIRSIQTKTLGMLLI